MFFPAYERLLLQVTGKKLSHSDRGRRSLTGKEPVCGEIEKAVEQRLTNIFACVTFFLLLLGEKDMSEKYYITTPIYYPSGHWHIGHCYTTVICDALARFNRMEGKDVFFLTGTDEHGKKIEEVAAAQGISPKECADRLVNEIKKLWKLLKISNDKFIRTTDEEHVLSVQKIFTRLYEKGDIYKGEYEGWYCTPCESFWTKSQLADGKCPDCGREVKKVKEESYFFRLSKYQKQLEELFENNPEFLQPQSRVNEMLNNFIRPGLSDLSVSRTSVDWGIKVPFDPKHTIYVWVDALSNYLSALGYLGPDDALMKYWPADLHMVGKEIVRFHSIIWPALLMALELPLPKRIYGHGWLLLDGDKMSKSKGNVADPFMLVDRYGVDALRYYLLREVPFGKDGSFSPEAYLIRYNSDLCNDLGNLVSRTTAMITQYFEGCVPEPGEKMPEDEDLIALAQAVTDKVRRHLAQPDVPEALASIFEVIQRANKYIDETSPWILNKTSEGRERLKTVLYNLAETIRISALLLAPFIPDTAHAVYERLGISDFPEHFEGNTAFGKLEAGLRVFKGEALFPRFDVKKETEYFAGKDETATDDSVRPEKPAVKTPEPEQDKKEDYITIDDFMKIKLKTAKVTACEAVEKKDKLLRLTLDVGGEERVVVSGIRKYYAPEYLVGKTVVLVANLKPAKLGGIMSEGMILCADADGDVVFVTPEKELPGGKTVR